MLNIWLIKKIITLKIRVHTCTRGYESECNMESLFDKFINSDQNLNEFMYCQLYTAWKCSCKALDIAWFINKT